MLKLNYYSYTEFGGDNLSDKQFKLKHRRTSKVRYFRRSGGKVFEYNWSLTSSQKEREVVILKTL